MCLLNTSRANSISLKQYNELLAESNIVFYSILLGTIELSAIKGVSGLIPINAAPTYVMGDPAQNQHFLTST